MDYSIFSFSGGLPWWAILAALWTLPWKGVALWKASRKGHLVWFVALLILNTLAILEILYIFVFSKMGAKKNVKRKTKKR